MLKILVLIVFSISFVYSKDIPMVQEIEVDIPVGKFNVIEFPFKVQKKKFSAFIYKEIKKRKKRQTKEKQGKVSIPKLNIEIPKKFKDINKKYSSKFKKATGIGSTNSSTKKKFKATWGDNFVQIFAKHIGSTQLIIWGYESYPMLLTINVVNTVNENADRYIKFIDYKNIKSTFSLKTDSHEKICSKLVWYLYNNKTPKGYKLSTRDETFNMGNFKLSFTKSISNRKYSAIEYKIFNNLDEKLILNEPMFAVGKNTVYAVSIENRELNPKEATRIFIVVPTAR